MANSIELAEVFLPLFDRAYKQVSKSAVLDIAPSLVKAGANAGTFNVAQLNVVGLGDYNRATGYKAGDLSMTWVPKTYTQDRGRTFTIDSMDELEALAGPFGEAMREFMRLGVTPEVDAYRFAKIATAAGLGTTGTLANAAAWISALNAAQIALEDEEVPTENLVLFITPSGHQAVTTAPNTATKCPLITEAQAVVKVPPGRFSTEITTNDGSSASAGGYTATGDDINFILMDRSAAFVDAKHAIPRIFDPATNQSANAWKFDYRIYHEAFVWDNKESGIYAHTVSES